MCRGCNVHQCRWKDDRSFHFSIFYCRKRKWFQNKLSKDRFEYEPFSQLVLPKKREIYLIALDKNSKFKRLVHEILSFVESL